MEVKINKDIREFSESIFFGLSLRQFIFSVLACIVAVILYFVLKPFFGIETLSWVCILGAAPFAILGFVKYNGMTAEKFVIAFIKSEFLIPKKLTFKAKNIYAEAFRPTIDRKLKQGILKPQKKNKEKKIRKPKKTKREVENYDENTKKDI
ncbi:MAG: PrgI family protein [Clostridia bacterium]|nr:PrgI family protein [Clostridia bacterium]